MALYVKFGKQKSMRKFLELFFSYQGEYVWIPKAQETFYHPGCKLSESQCEPGRSRSFRDMLDLLQTYYKTADEKKVLHELMMLRITAKDRDGVERTCYVSFKSCFLIEEINMYISTQPARWDYLMNYSQYDSPKNWRQLFKQIGVETEEDYKNYYEKHTNLKNEQR